MGTPRFNIFNDLRMSENNQTMLLGLLNAKYNYVCFIITVRLYQNKSGIENILLSSADKRFERCVCVHAKYLGNETTYLKSRF